MTFPMLPTLVWNYNKANIAAKTHLDFSLNGIKKIAWPILKITSQLTQKTFFFCKQNPPMFIDYRHAGYNEHCELTVSAGCLYTNCNNEDEKRVLI